MALQPVGSGSSVTITSAGAQVSSSFEIKSNALRICASNADAFVAINTGTTDTSSSDFYIPSGTVGTLALNRASTTAVNIEEGNTSAQTKVTLPEGRECPFIVGDYVSITGADEAQYNLTHKKVLDITSPVPSMGYSQSTLHIEGDVSGVTTAYLPNVPATVRKSVCLGVSGVGSGAVYYQQVQITGDA